MTETHTSDREHETAAEPRSPGAARTAVLIAAGLSLSACAAWWARSGDVTGRVAPHLLVYGLAFAAYLAALAASRGLAGRRLAGALVLAVAWRAALLPSPPLLSEDVYRYLWEGRVQLHGGNPYAYEDRATAEKWAPLRDELWGLMANKRYTAVYPPLFQLAALAVVSVHHSVLAMKLFVVGCELALWAVLWRLLLRRGLPASRLLVAAWSPLALVELAGSGHNDSFGLLLLCLSLLALDAGRTSLSAGAAALGAAAKVIPGFVALAWFRRYRPRDVALAGLLAALTALPYVSAGSGLWRGTSDYGSWRFNESLLALVDAFAPSRLAAQRAAGLAVLALAVALGVRRQDPARAGLVVIAAWIALSAHVLPWYALWLLPWLTLRDEPAALLFTFTVGFGYMVYPGFQSGAGWQVPWGMRALEYLPPLAVLAWSAWQARRRARAAP
jgi:hypothetical protein